jgi:hypothetical protein
VRVGSQEANVDEGIAPLIREMWIAGIRTSLSCQQNTLGRIWIDFPDVFELIRFLNIIARYGDGLYWRMKAGRCDDTKPPPDWEYTVTLDDDALVEDIVNDCIEESYQPPADFAVAISVRFPPQDLPTVLERLVEFNEQVRRLDDHLRRKRVVTE